MEHPLVVGIYSDWLFFAKIIHHPTTQKETAYSIRQEEVCKDVERCFGVLQFRFEIIRREDRRREVDEVEKVDEMCVILHDMLIKMVDNGDIKHGDGEENGKEILQRDTGKF